MTFIQPVVSDEEQILSRCVQAAVPEREGEWARGLSAEFWVSADHGNVEISKKMKKRFTNEILAFA